MSFRRWSDARLTFSVVCMAAVVGITLGCDRRVPLADQFTDVPPVGIRLRAPVGFELQEGPVLDDPKDKDQAFIEMGRIPASYPERAPHLTADQWLEQQGKTLISEEPFQVGPYPGVLRKFAYERLGLIYLQWSLEFGDDQQYFHVDGKAYDEDRARFDETLRQCVTSVELLPLDGDPSICPYEIDPIEGLRRVKNSAFHSGRKGWGRTSMYVVDGVIPIKSPAEPMFIVAPSLGKVGPIQDLRKTALFFLDHTQDLKVKKVHAVEPVKIDGQPGIEIFASGQSVDEPTDLEVYELLLLRDDGSHVLIAGFIGEEYAAEFLPKFQAAAQSFRWKAK